MKRWHEEAHITQREWRRHRREHVEHNINYGQPGRDPFVVACTCDDQVGRFRKRRAFDCGRARCQMCHGEKFPKRLLTRRERIARLNFREQLGA